MPTPLISPLRHRARIAGARIAGAQLALAALVAPVALRAQSPFSSLTFFGDSYSDTGNAYLLTGGTLPPSPPYAAGRFSNGPIWVDYFAQALGRPGDTAPAFLTRAASGDYAVASARTTGSLISTQAQIASYLSRPGVGPGTATDPSGLYALFAGGDDLRDAGALADPAARQAAAAAAAQHVVTQAGLLAGAGAGNVLLFTLPSLGATPEAQGIPGRPAIEDQLARTFNATLSAGLAGLETTFGTTRFFDFRLDNLFTNILHDAQAGGSLYGLTNVTTPCFGPPFGPLGAPSCDVSVFADSLHPTTRTDQFIAQAAVRYVTTGENVAVTPEPATVVLVGAGVLALAGVARQRRSADASVRSPGTVER